MTTETAGASVLRVAITLLLVLQLGGGRSLSAQATPVSEDCVQCHLDLEDDRLVEPARSFPADVHAETGFGCLSCHGGGGQGELSPAGGFLSAPQRRDVAEMCGRCHSDPAYMRQFDPGLRVDQVSEYGTSAHGLALAERNDPDVATCVDCHPAHSIRPPDDPESSVYAANVPETCGRCHSDPERMEKHGLGTDQVDQHASSVHGRLLYEDGDVGAPVCNDCHGNHGAAPPGMAAVRNVCGQCHSVMADFFDESGHEPLFEDEQLPLCATCHDHHAVQSVDEASLGERSEAVCTQCHVPGDDAGLSFQAMAALLDSLTRSAAHGRERLEEAERMGMEVSQALFDLEDVNNSQTRARSAIHTFSVDAVSREVDAGLAIANTAAERADDAFAEYDFRRYGLGVSSGIILLLVTGLLLKIRDMEERAEGLLAEVAAFYSRSVAPTWTGAPTGEQVRLAACALLLEAAHADDDFTAEERDHLEDLVHWHFGLVRSEAEELIDLAISQRRGAVAVGRIARMIAADYSLEQKRVLLEELWSLVYSDGELTRRELEFVEDVAALLGLHTRELADARRRVRGSRGTVGRPE